VLTAGAKKALLDYPWEGNSIQLEAFCERMILTVGKRAITEEYVRDLLDELYCQDTSMAKQEISEDPAPERWEEESEEPEELIKIKNALRKYNGNRTLSAKELKFSTTTLWRKMKKYGLDENMDAIFVK
jgi:DNA-binding NtrC family response regulator